MSTLILARRKNNWGKSGKKDLIRAIKSGNLKKIAFLLTKMEQTNKMTYLIILICKLELSLTPFLLLPDPKDPPLK